MGTGIMRIKKATKEAKVAMPKFELDGFFKVTFKRENSQAVASDKKAIKTSDSKINILSFIKKHKDATASEISIQLNLRKVRVRAILQEMTNEKTIEKIGKNRYAYYILKT